MTPRKLKKCTIVQLTGLPTINDTRRRWLKLVGLTLALPPKRAKRSVQNVFSRLLTKGLHIQLVQLTEGTQHPGVELKLMKMVYTKVDIGGIAIWTNVLMN